MINIPAEPLLFDLFYGGKGAGEESEEDLLKRMKTAIPPVTEETPSFRNIHISNIYCKGSGRAMFFNGLPEMPINNITVKNVVMTNAKEGAVISYANGVIMENIKIVTAGGDLVKVKNSKDITINGTSYKEINNEGKVIDLQ